MGRIEYEDALKTAVRYRRTRELQESRSTEEGQARMLDRRRDLMLATGRVFFESIIDGSDLLPIRYLEMGQLAARSVGRIHLVSTGGGGSGFATGFLVAPGLLLTNQHVLPTAAAALAATVTMDAQDSLSGLPSTPRVFQLDPNRAYVADAALDFAFVGVRPRATDSTPLASYGYLRLHGRTGKVVREEFVSIIQHPNGRQKHIAARNNQVRVYAYDLDLSDEEQKQNAFIYYSTDTLKGSSGAPVLSDQWFVVALHRRGVPKTGVVDDQPVVMRRNRAPAAVDDPDEVIAYESNEGVRISRIVERLEERASSGPDVDRRMAAYVASAVREAAGAPSDGPFLVHAQPYSELRERRRRAVDLAPHVSVEISRRNLNVFPEGVGYNPDFLPGVHIPLPQPMLALQQELAPRSDRPDSFWLPFRHFSTLMHARRRMPVLAAVNIAGHLKPAGGMPTRPKWAYDPRIDEEHQPDDSIFSNMVQRGHMAAREYVYWGEDEDEVKQADTHSFTLTNACPQIASFNSNGEWYKVERLVMAGSKVEELKVTEFMGPIFRADDPEYDSLRGPGSDAELGTRIRIPLRFWKIVLWVEDAKLQHKAFLLDQRDELAEAGPLEMDLDAPEGVEETTVEAIGQLTDLDWGGLMGAL